MEEGEDPHHLHIQEGLPQAVLETMGEAPPSEEEPNPTVGAGTVGRQSLDSAGSLPTEGLVGVGFRSAPELLGEF